MLSEKQLLRLLRLNHVGANRCVITEPTDYRDRDDSDDGFAGDPDGRGATEEDPYNLDIPRTLGEIFR